MESGFGAEDLIIFLIVKRIALKYGLMMAAGFTLYFLVMQAIGLGTNYYFRILNALIQLLFITAAIKAYKDHYPKEFNYVGGVTTGVLTSAIGVLPFTVFMGIFLSITPDFMAEIQAQAESLGTYLTPFTAVLIIAVEGLAVSIVVSYVIMRIVDSYR